MQNNEQIIFKIILHAGLAKNQAMEAVDLAMNKQIQQATIRLETAKQELDTAHSLHSALLGEEAKGESPPLSLLLVHAENHLMSGVTELQLSGTIIRLCEQLHERGSL